jgi:hypothetical protein
MGNPRGDQDTPNRDSAAPSRCMPVAGVWRIDAWAASGLTGSFAESLTKEVRAIRSAPFARVRRQMLNILRGMNRLRPTTRLEPVPITAFRVRRRRVSVFATAR